MAIARCPATSMRPRWQLRGVGHIDAAAVVIARCPATLMRPRWQLRGAHFVRRRRSLLLAGGWWRGAPPTPGNDGTHTPFPGGDVPPARDALRATMPSARLPGVAPAPRLQPPANHRERLRRTPQRAPRVPIRHASADGAPHHCTFKKIGSKILQYKEFFVTLHRFFRNGLE